MTRLHGIDLSHHNIPGQQPWEAFAKSSQFIIARATYGTMRDRAAAEHIRLARSHGLRVGLYHFHRPEESVTNQLKAFNAAAEACGLDVGDIVPALDIEDDGPNRPVSRDWAPHCWELCEALVSKYGDCIVYVTQRDWHRLGEPEWLLQRPLWVAHWTAALSPATPGNVPWTLWQYRVGAYQPGSFGGFHNPGTLDHNWAERLPTIGERDERPTAPPGGIYDEEAGECRVADTDRAPPMETDDGNA